jgi:hypothetical protein
MACVCLSVWLALLGRVSSDLDMMSRAMKILHAVALGWEILGCVFVFR